MFRFRRTVATLIGIGTLAAWALGPAIPASAQGNGNEILDATAYQYYRYCDFTQTPPQCNLQGATQLYFVLGNTGGRGAQTVPYTILNGTAVDYVGFDIPMTGYVNIPSEGSGAFIVPVLNAGDEPGATGTFTVVLGGGATATGTILLNAELPADCSLSSPAYYDIAATCTDRPAGQVWYIWAWCLSWDGYQICKSAYVTGDGMATIYSEDYPVLDGEVTFAST